MFKLIKKDKDTQARLGKLTTAHGEIDTPNFMPVGTSATVKTLTPDEIKLSGSQVILSNAYHLLLRPGPETIKKAGGLHKFMGWNGPILTDSGGFQVFSLSKLRKIKDDGVEFQSHIDGSKHFITPESVIEFQQLLGSDIMMVLDECVPYPCQRDYTEKSLRFTTDWAKRSKKQFSIEEKSIKRYPLSAKRSQLFGIVQGGSYKDLRKQSAEELMAIGFDGYAIGGLSVGEPRELMYELIEITIPVLPQESVHYLMGVGTVLDMLESIERGADIFDCVVPTRNGRNGVAFTSMGKINIHNAKYKQDNSSLDTECECPCCTGYSRSYLHHMFNVNEILGLRLLSLHNITFYAKLMQNIRLSIEEDRFKEFKREVLTHYAK